jgi:hypothetical protein
MAIAYHLKYLGGQDEEDWVQASPCRKKQKTKKPKKKKKKRKKQISKKPREKWARGVTPEVQYVPSKCKTLRSINLHN